MRLGGFGFLGFGEGGLVVDRCIFFFVVGGGRGARVGVGLFCL